jgi:ATP-dependent DNA helicase RecQ
MFRLQAMIRYAESTGCRRRSLVTYFGDAAPEGLCGMCDNCVAEAGGRQRVDVSADARLFLECLRQTGQRFGATYVVDVLRGSHSARVAKWRHEKLPVHGAGRHRSPEMWRLLGDRFIELGLVEAELEHGTLRLTEEGSRVLAEEAPVLVFLETPKAAARTETPGAADPVLFEALRQLRRQVAEAARVPPYVIFSDRTLAEMAAAAPQSREALLRVHGVGEHKAAVYGERFLEVIRGRAAGGAAGEAPSEPPAAPAAPPGRRAIEVGEAFRSGSGLDALQERWGVTRETILAHLYTYHRSGGALDAERLLEGCRLPAAGRERVLAVFDELGDDRLGPVHAALDGEVDYTELRLLRLYRLCRASGDGSAPGSPGTRE